MCNSSSCEALRAVRVLCRGLGVVPPRPPAVRRLTHTKTAQSPHCAGWDSPGVPAGDHAGKHALKPYSPTLNPCPTALLQDRDSLVYQTGTMKLADFGLSKSLPMNKHAGFDLESKFKLTGETGSYRYMAPEVFRHEPYNFKVYISL